MITKQETYEKMTKAVRNSDLDHFDMSDGLVQRIRAVSTVLDRMVQSLSLPSIVNFRETELPGALAEAMVEIEVVRHKYGIFNTEWDDAIDEAVEELVGDLQDPDFTKYEF